MSKINKAPWNDEQVANIKAYQQEDFGHPLTCGNCPATLEVTKDGLVCPTGDGHFQDWAPDFIVDGRWKRVIEEIETASQGLGRAVADELFPPDGYNLEMVTARAVEHFERGQGSINPISPIDAARSAIKSLTKEEIKQVISSAPRSGVFGTEEQKETADNTIDSDDETLIRDYTTVMIVANIFNTYPEFMRVIRPPQTSEN